MLASPGLVADLGDSLALQCPVLSRRTSYRRGSRRFTDVGEEDESGVHAVEGERVQYCVAAADL